QRLAGPCARPEPGPEGAEGADPAAT
ncbi:MAG: hypothetical protein JWM12_694, partial [Ilumatobacteraceae bacterium]|nr:hypothetical protein [Ilumatobacteraceae bacterium]